MRRSPLSLFPPRLPLRGVPGRAPAKPTVPCWTLSSRGNSRDLLRAAVLDTLSSPEGQELIAKAVRRELSNRR